ncbi:MAG TPA: hypothetical protein PLZ77_01540 [Lachnospiraceae bacterium]|nr:hypothetical protein [Lachnospiraceae bacterium]
MSVNGITGNVSSDYTGYQKPTTDAKAAEATASTQATDSTGVVYETKAPEQSAKTYTSDTNLIAKMKADSQARIQQLQDIVEKLMTKQSTAYSQANGLKNLFSSLSVDPATRAQAEADIAEDGYWGVNQTSDRIFDFAKALSGGDPTKMEEMKNAFLKGYKKAEKMWGDALPDISKKTYDAVLNKFDEFAKAQDSSTETTEN